MRADQSVSVVSSSMQSPESRRGQPQSKTCRNFEMHQPRASVLDCGCPLPLCQPLTRQVPMAHRVGAQYKKAALGQSFNPSTSCILYNPGFCSSTHSAARSAPLAKVSRQKPGLYNMQDVLGLKD